MDEFEAELEAYMAQGRLTLSDITLETDEIGIWLLVGDQQAGHVSWYEITKRIQQQLLQEKFLIALAETDAEEGLI